MLVDNVLWERLEALDETITKLLALRDVLSIHEFSRDVMVEILDSYVEEFSEKHRAVYERLRTLYNSESSSLDSVFTQALEELEKKNND